MYSGAQTLISWDREVLSYLYLRKFAIFYVYKENKIKHCHFNSSSCCARTCCIPELTHQTPRKTLVTYRQTDKKTNTYRQTNKVRSMQIKMSADNAPLPEYHYELEYQPFFISIYIHAAVSKLLTLTVQGFLLVTFFPFHL